MRDEISGGRSTDRSEGGPTMLNAFTVDVEDWYHGNDFNIDFRFWHDFEDRVCGSTERLLDLLALHVVKATFFVLGFVAERHPKLVERIAREGHEVGTHGYCHRLVYTQTREEYREDLRRSKAALEDITGKALYAYRAPSWSITCKSLWALEILEEEGFLYDSSIFPVVTPFGGIVGAPRFPYKPTFQRQHDIIEFPPSVLEVAGVLRVPFSGGFFLRGLPCRFIQRALRSINGMGFPALVYVHPWELDLEQPVLQVPFPRKFIHYRGLRTTQRKIEALLGEFRFAPAGEVLGKLNHRLG